ncbi:MFS transporter [Clostridium swellfunianum]|uniref:MFS transporter n=1 Tax=Clostridium swellfunianum TaxID=1367462 RepID=UPI00202F6843|nr:MFS transporter [Clostridium swellfunianum]MCM0649223.1 MFS transporter [Clostridium swellfunianum]
MNLTKRAFNKLDIYSGLPKSIYILSMVRVVNAMGNFVYPFLTLFLTEHIGFSKKAAGDYFMISAFAQAAGSLIGGKLTDNFGRKKLFMIFQGFAALCFAPCAFLGDSIWVPRLLITAGFFMSAAQPANSAMVTDLTNKHNRKQAFSLLYLGINLGFSIGPMIAGFLYRNHTSLIFLGNTVSIVITLIVLFLFIEDTAPTREEIEESKSIEDDESAEDSNVLIALIKRPSLSLFLVGKTINAFVYSTIGFVIPIQMTQAFGSDLGSKYFGFVMATNGITIIICTTFIIKATMNIKPVINVALASLFYAVGFGMLGFVNSFFLYIVAAVIYTLGEILEATNAGVYIANHSPINHRGRFNAVIPLITGVGFSFGPSIFGRFIDAYGTRKLWIMCFILASISSAFMRWLRGYEMQNNKE